MKGIISKRCFKTISVIVILCLLMYMSINWMMLNEQETVMISWQSLAHMLPSASLVITGLSCIVIAGLNNRVSPEWFFLIIYISLEIMYLTVIPLSSTPDETEHWLRAYGISQGDFVPETNDAGEGGSYVPSNITYMWNRSGSRIKDMKDNLMMEASPDREFLTYSNTALYSPLTYAPQTIGIGLARLICNKPYLWAYAGRVTNMLTVGLIIFAAIRISPIGKNIIATLTLLPINMYESASLSGGAFTYAVTVLLISYVLWLRYRKQGEMTKKEKLLLYLLLLFTASCKIVYVPFVLMAFAVPPEKLGDRKQYRFHIACAAIMILLASLGWMSISRRYLIEYKPGVDSIAQMKFVLMHPFNYVQTIINTVMYSGEWIIKTFFAASLGYFNVGTNLLMMMISAVNLIYICVTDKLVIRTAEKEGNNKHILPVMLLVSSLISALLVFTSEYVQWTPYQDKSVDGLQGRYFLPVLLPMLILIKEKIFVYAKDGTGTKKAEEVYGDEKGMMYPGMLICFVNLMTIITLFVSYI